MSDYRIEKTRRRIAVVFHGGRRIEGDLFLQPSMRYRLGPEAPEELFNGGDPFFPLAIDGGGSLMIAKDRVIRVEYPTGEDDTLRGAIGAPVELELELSDGSTVIGLVHPEVRAERSRVLDFLNVYEGRFLPVACGEGTSLIHRGAIVSVRERRAGT